MRIREVDAKVKRDEPVDPEALTTYLLDIQTAKKEEIKAADVILCTCTTSAAGKICNNTNVVQVIHYL